MADATLEQKRDLILANERTMAGQVALEAVDRPILAMWMILIPIFFVFYYFQLRRYKNGLKEFIDQFMVSRRRALSAVYEGLAAGREVDLEDICKMGDGVNGSVDEYRDWLAGLIEYYRTLLSAEGTTFQELVRNGFTNKTNYLLVINRLGSRERAFHAALVTRMNDTEGTFGEVVGTMEKRTESFRREQAEEVF